jgi:hypothetical protein
MPRQITRLEREVTVEILPPTDAAAEGEWFDIGPFPSGSVHLYSVPTRVGEFGVGSYEAVVRGAGASDALAHTGVVAIDRISDTDGGPADYEEGVNYQLTGDAVEWLSGGPAETETYYVVYRFNSPAGLDARVEQANGTLPPVPTAVATVPTLVLTKPVSLVRVVVADITAGRVGAMFHGARQN